MAPHTEKDLNRHIFLGLAAVMFGLACGIIGLSGGLAMAQESAAKETAALTVQASASKPAVKPPAQQGKQQSPPQKVDPKPQAPIAPKVAPTPSGLLPFGSEEWLRSRLMEAGLSPDQARGMVAMNRVEGGTLDHRSILGFTEAQTINLVGFGGPEGHVQAFLRYQWNDMSRRGPGGSIPGVHPDGTVHNIDEYLTWIRVRIVGQLGYASDWEGNRQPPPDVYQRHLRSAWDGVTPVYGWGMPGGPDNP